MSILRVTKNGCVEYNGGPNGTELCKGMCEYIKKGKKELYNILITGESRMINCDKKKECKGKKALEKGQKKTI